MQIITPEWLRSLSAEALHETFYYWFAEVEGFKPRHIAVHDREYILAWCEEQLTPEAVARYEAQVARENALIEEWERDQEELRMAEQFEFETESELRSAYCTAYDAHDPRLSNNGRI